MSTPEERARQTIDKLLTAGLYHEPRSRLAFAMAQVFGKTCGEKPI